MAANVPNMFRMVFKTLQMAPDVPHRVGTVPNRPYVEEFHDFGLFKDFERVWKILKGCWKF